MPTQDLSHWILISLSMIHKTDLSSSGVGLTNKAWLDPGDATGSYDYLPLIIGGTRIGTASDREMILPEAGSIKIDNSIGSFGVDRKLSDLLERYEIVDQLIIISYGTSEIDGTALEEGSGGFIGKVLDWNHAIDQGRPVIDLRFDSKKIAKRVINRRVDINTFPDAPISSLGKSLPVVFGSSQQVKPIAVSAIDTLDNYSLTYATTLATEHPVAYVGAYAKDHNGKYTSVVSASDANTEVFSFTSSTTELTVNNQLYITRFKLDTDTSNNYIITHIDVKFEGQGLSDTRTGTISVNIYGSTMWGYGTNSIRRPDHDKVLATGSREANDHDSDFDGGTDFYITFALNKPLVLASDELYYIGVSFAPNASNTGTVEVRYAASGSVPAWLLSANGIWYTDNYGTGNIIDFKAYGLEFTDTPNGSGTIDDNGLGAAFVTLNQKTAINAYIPNPRLSGLDFVFTINGLNDDSFGSITGSANSQITTVHHAIKLMAQEYNGSTWEVISGTYGYWDFTEYSDTYFSSNAIAGSTDGETTFEQWLRQVCRNTATKIVLLYNGKVAPYSWGTTRTSAATFTQENSKATRLEQLDSSYVVNRVTIAYARALIYFDSLIAASQGVPSDYTGILNYNSDTSAEYSALIGVSEEIYGIRELSEIYFNWINSSDAAARIARYYLTNFNTPPRYIEIEAPNSDFHTLEIMDVVTVINPSLPNYYGGIPSAKLPHFEGEEVDPLDGYNLCEAQSYRAQIEGKTLSFNEDGAPTLNLICRLLTNYPNDPT